MNRKIEKSIELGGRKLTLSTGHLASQADAAVLASYGETVVLATVVSQPLYSDLGYFPLTIEYQERLYAGGRIKGSRWVKREGRPSDEEILTGRLIDRSVRPLFPKGYKKEVQVIVTVLSVDLENSPDIPSSVATSAALAVSKIPWNGPVSVVRVGIGNDGFIINPTTSQLSVSDLDLVVTTTGSAIIMIEAGSKEVKEEKLLGAISFAQKEGEMIINLINDLAKEAGIKKEEVETDSHSQDIKNQVKKIAEKKIEDLIKKTSLKKAGQVEYNELKSAIVDSFSQEEAVHVINVFEELFREIGRKMILSGKRADARKSDEIRPLSAQVNVLPRTHGSAIFSRGETQVLTVTTLASHQLEQLIESAEGEESKRYIHHYSMPPFSTGETGRVGYPNRREIGHGALAERALVPVIPSEEDFPYTIRVVSEVMSSNGSTSMASVCGSTLSLMDAGVPLTVPISGIAMGLVIDNPKKFVVLSDITGLEDGIGDMDFKVAGSKDGVTALQLDVKTPNLTPEILEEALKQAKEARIKILEVMQATIDKPRDSVSRYAPKIKVIRINPEKIGELIGPGGKTIRRITKDTGAQIDVDEDGTVYVSGTTKEELDAGIQRVEAFTKEPLVGEIYEGVVKRVQPFGAFVEILPGKEGLVHVSDISEEYVKDPSEYVRVGGKVQVRVKGVDDMGRLNLSMVLDPGFDIRKEERRKERDARRPFPRGDRGRPRSSGPHFPTSRFLSDNKKKYSG